MERIDERFPKLCARIRLGDSDLSDYFTPLFLHELLRTEVLRSLATLPSVSSESVVDLARWLSALKRGIEFQNGCYEEGRKLKMEFAKAFDELQALSPLVEAEYEYVKEKYASGANDDDPKNRKFHADFLSDLKDIRQLQDIMARLGRGVYLCQTTFEKNQPINGWTNIAPSLIWIFHKTWPDASKASGYRFVQHLAPHLIGETPSYQAVETHLKKKRQPRGPLADEH
jgi:hypothetical protein